MTAATRGGRGVAFRPPDAPSLYESAMWELHFGEFSAEIDESRCHGLFRSHQPVGLSDVPRKVLFLLLQHRPRPVGAKVLLKELWPPGVNPSNIARQVRALRVAMGDERAQRYIATVKKEGYAFVMPVTEHAAAPVVDQHPIAAVTAGDAASAAPSKREWRLAKDKLVHDFRGSCLHDLELLEEAIAECRRRIQLIATERRLRLAGRFPHEPLLVPPRRLAAGRWAAARDPDTDLVSRTAELMRYAGTAPVVVNVGAYAPACIAVLQSLRRRFGLDVRADFEALTARQQVLRLAHDDEADFLLAPHGPVLLVGDHGALDYRWMTPVHAYEQIVLRVPGSARGRRRKLLVYKGGSPEEQLMARVGIPASAEPEIVWSLETLLAKVEGLAPGDMVIAWQPLASGLESRHRFTRVAEFRCWLSLFCHKRWQRGPLRALKDQFKLLFAGEWLYCRSNREWAIECLAVELKALEFFTAGSGLARAPEHPPRSSARRPRLSPRHSALPNDTMASTDTIVQ
jgi:DNA-binding winged helix-turn-helix (wHTH) protein